MIFIDFLFCWKMMIDHRQQKCNLFALDEVSFNRLILLFPIFWDNLFVNSCKLCKHHHLSTTQSAFIHIFAMWKERIINYNTFKRVFITNSTNDFPFNFLQNWIDFYSQLLLPNSFNALSILRDGKMFFRSEL